MYLNHYFHAILDTTSVPDDNSIEYENFNVLVVMRLKSHRGEIYAPAFKNEKKNELIVLQRVHVAYLLILNALLVVFVDEQS